MSEDYLEYHQQFLAALAVCQEKAGSEIEKIGSCFKCSLDHWGKMQKQVRLTDFENFAEEIPSSRISSLFSLLISSIIPAAIMRCCSCLPRINWNRCILEMGNAEDGEIL